MMRSRGTLILVSAALALLAYILVFERRPSRPAPDQDHRLFPELNPARVVSVSIIQTNANGVLRVERTEAGWQLTNPLHPALALAVNPWLESLAALGRGAHLKSSDVLGQPGGLAALGLEPPRALVTIDQGNRRFQVRLGHRTPLGHRMYLQIVGSDGVEVTDAQPLDMLPASHHDWRDPALVHLAGRRVDHLALRTASREYQVRQPAPGADWRLESPRPARADSARIEQLLLQLAETRVVQFATDIVTADLEPYGLQTPVGELTLSSGTNTLLRLAFGRSPTNAPNFLYVQRSRPPGIVVAPSSIFDNVALPYTDLLDYRMVDRPLDSLSRIQAAPVGGAGFTLEKSTGGVWQITAPLARPTDPGLVTAFLDRLRSLRAIEVAKEIVDDSELPAYGLTTPMRRYNLQWIADGTNPPPALQFDLGTNRADRVMARRADENPVYSLALADCIALPIASLQLRDRRIWSFSTNQVQAVTITHQGMARRLLRSPAGQWSFAPGSQGMVNTFALEDAVHRLGQLRAAWWEAEGKDVPLDQYGIPQVAHQLAIELLVDGQRVTRILDFGATSRSGGPFGVVTLEAGPAVFELPLELFHPYDQVVRSMDLPKPSVEAGKP